MEKYENIDLSNIEINDTIKNHSINFIFSDSDLTEKFIEYILKQTNDSSSAGDIENFLKSIARLSSKFKNLITNLLIKKILENPKNKLLLDKMKHLLEDLGVDINNLNLGEFIGKIRVKDGKNINKNSLLSDGKIDTKKVRKKLNKLKQTKKTLVKSGIISKLLNKLSNKIIKDKNTVQNKETGKINIDGKEISNEKINKLRKTIEKENGKIDKNPKYKSDTIDKLTKLNERNRKEDEKILKDTKQTLKSAGGFLGAAKAAMAKASSVLSSIKRSVAVGATALKSGPSVGSGRTTSSVSFSGKGGSGGLGIGGREGGSKEFSKELGGNRSGGEIVAESKKVEGSKLENREMNGKIPEINNAEQNRKVTSTEQKSSTQNKQQTESTVEKPSVGNSVGNSQASDAGHDSQSNGKSASDKNLSGLASISTAKDTERHAEKNGFGKPNNAESKNKDDEAHKDNNDIINSEAGTEGAELDESKQLINDDFSFLLKQRKTDVNDIISSMTEINNNNLSSIENGGTNNGHKHPSENRNLDLMIRQMANINNGTLDLIGQGSPNIKTPDKSQTPNMSK